MEQWLDIALATSRWFSAQPGVNAYPFDGIMTADEFWEEWSTGPNGLDLLPEIVTSGREFQLQQLLTTLQGKATVTGIKASTKNEAIALLLPLQNNFLKTSPKDFFKISCNRH